MKRADLSQALRSYYNNPRVSDRYTGRELRQAEKEIIAHLDREIRDRRVLEIGVGPGRTTPHLRKLTRRYVGIDYSPSMIKPCRRANQDADLVVSDARHLSFQSASFDVVYFSWNAIDDADHNDRLLMLSEANRVLAPGAVFFFSSHNLEGIAVDLGRFVVVSEQLHYAIILDSRDDSGLPAYYIRKEVQKGQLETAGFSSVRMVARDGTFIEAGECCLDPCIYYIARKSPECAVS